MNQQKRQKSNQQEAISGMNPAIIVALAGAGALGALVALLLSFSYWQTRQLLTPKRKPLERRPADVGLEVEEVRIPGPNGALAGWYLPSTNGCTIICCHGIHDNRGQWVEQMNQLHLRGGYGALLFDFAGHGDSQGDLVTFGPREAHDIAAVVEYLRSRGDVDMDHLGIIGYSLGAIATILAAADIPELRCVVVESGFSDLQEDISMLFRRYTGMPSFPFANLVVFWGELISRVRLADIRPARVIHRVSPRAVFIISDLHDEIANEPYDGELLYANAGEPKRLWQLPGISHVSAFPADPFEWVAQVGDFFDEYLAGVPASLPAQSQQERL